MQFEDLAPVCVFMKICSKVVFCLCLGRNTESLLVEKSVTAIA